MIDSLAILREDLDYFQSAYAASARIHSVDSTHPALVRARSAYQAALAEYRDAVKVGRGEGDRSIGADTIAGEVTRGLRWPGLSR